MSKTVVVKKPNDPMGTRISIGGVAGDSYFVYRGNLKDAIETTEKALEAAKKQLEQGEPPVESN